MDIIFPLPDSSHLDYIPLAGSDIPALEAIPIALTYFFEFP